jgi:hypothetical protein
MATGRSVGVLACAIGAAVLAAAGLVLVSSRLIVRTASAPHIPEGREPNAVLAPDARAPGSLSRSGTAEAIVQVLALTDIGRYERGKHVTQNWLVEAQVLQVTRGSVGPRLLRFTHTEEWRTDVTYSMLPFTYAVGVVHLFGLDTSADPIHIVTDVELVRLPAGRLFRPITLTPEAELRALTEITGYFGKAPVVAVPIGQTTRVYRILAVDRDGMRRTFEVRKPVIRPQIEARELGNDAIYPPKLGEE